MRGTQLENTMREIFAKLTRPIEGRVEFRWGDLDRVRGSADHLVRMISDVLDLSRIEAGQLEVTRQDVDVAHP